MDLRAFPFETFALDSGFRRIDEFEAMSWFVIPAKDGIQWLKKFDVYIIMAL